MVRGTTGIKFGSNVRGDHRQQISFKSQGYSLAFLFVQITRLKPCVFVRSNHKAIALRFCSFKSQGYSVAFLITYDYLRDIKFVSNGKGACIACIVCIKGV